MTKAEIKTIQKLWIHTMNNCQLYEEQGETKKLITEIGVLKGLYYVQDYLGINICLYRHFEHFMNILSKETCPMRSKNKGEKNDKTN